MSKLADTIQGLIWAAPFVLASRKPNSMAACYEMSLVGSEALRAFDFDAKPLPCVVIAQSPDRARGHCLGLTIQELRARVGSEGGEVLEFEDQGEHHHVAIEVKHRGTRAVIDLTLGQLRHYGIPATLSAWAFSKDWPAFEVEGWVFQYESSPRADEALARTFRYRDKLGGMVGDMEEMIRVARQCRDYDQFFESVKFSMIEADRSLWAEMVAIMESWKRPESLPA